MSMSEERERYRQQLIITEEEAARVNTSSLMHTKVWNKLANCMHQMLGDSKIWHKRDLSTIPCYPDARWVLVSGRIQFGQVKYYGLAIPQPGLGEDFWKKAVEYSEICFKVNYGHPGLSERAFAKVRDDYYAFQSQYHKMVKFYYTAASTAGNCGLELAMYIHSTKRSIPITMEKTNTTTSDIQDSILTQAYINAVMAGFWNHQGQVLYTTNSRQQFTVFCLYTTGWEVISEWVNPNSGQPIRTWALSLPRIRRVSMPHLKKVLKKDWSKVREYVLSKSTAPDYYELKKPTYDCIEHGAFGKTLTKEVTDAS